MASTDGVRDLFAPPRVLAVDGGETGEFCFALPRNWATTR